MTQPLLPTARATQPQGHILVAEDDPSVRRLLAWLLSSEGYRVDQAEDGEAATALLRTAPFDLVITDLLMPRCDGMALLQRIKAQDADLPVLLLTAHSSVQGAIDAIRLGAFDYIEKPIDHDRLRTAARNAVAQRQLQLKARLLEAPPTAGPFHGILGQSGAMRWVFQLIERVARYPTPTLITGESGTGKELVARALHAASPRASGPLVAVNSASIVDTLFESTLFGHKRGSFTGADRDRKGLLEQADGGTLFLDEIGEMSLSGQAKLLRVLETREVLPVGASQPRSVDVRVVSATNRELLDAIEEGRFRRDLYYRLCGVNIALPPLRARGEDLILLANHFLQGARTRMESLLARELAPEVLAAFRDYAWPGNVRELRQIIESAAVLCDGPTIRLHHLPPALRPARPQPPTSTWQPTAAPTPTPGASPGAGALDDEDGVLLTLHALEARHLARAAVVCGNNRSEMARRLGISRHALYRLLHKHGL